MAADKPAKPRQATDDDDDSGDTIRISMEALHTSIEQVKLLRAGILPAGRCAKCLPRCELNQQPRTRLRGQEGKLHECSGKLAERISAPFETAGP